MLMLLGRLLFLAFMLNIVAHYVPKLKQQKWMEFLETLTLPVTRIIEDFLPFSKDTNLILSNLISGFGAMVLAGILKFIL